MRDKKKISGEALQQTASLLAATLESTADGLLVIDNSGKVTIYNNKFLSMWHIPESLAAKRDDKILLESVLDQLKDPDGFVEKVKQLYSQPEANSFDVLEFKDGRFFERFSQPQRFGNEIVGRVWSFRDVTDRRRVEEEQRRDRESAERLAEEMAVIADIGRLISSTLDIDEVYERFAAEARKLIPFDRIAVNVKHPHEDISSVAYVSGLHIPSRRQGTSTHEAGSLNGAVLCARTGLLIQPEGTPEGIAEIVSRFPLLSPSFQAGLLSFLSVPLIYRDAAVGVLHFRSKKTRAYTERDLHLAERIGAQIAGAIANAQMFTELQKTERSLRESEGRFRALVEQAAVGVAGIEMSTGRFFTVNRRLCEMVGRTEEEMLATTFQAITHPDDLHLHEGKKALLAAGKIGDYSLEKRYLRKDGGIVWVNITVSPLWKPGETPGRNMVVFEDITERKRIEEEQRRNHDVTKRLAQEIAIISEIGKVVGSTLDTNEIYERFAAEARTLIPFDRVSVNLINPDGKSFTNAYVSGFDVPGRRPGTIVPLAGSVSEIFMRQRQSGRIIHVDSSEDLVRQFPDVTASLVVQAGIRSLIGVPLIYRNEVIGSLHFRSKISNAYTEQDLRLAEKIGEQIAGAIANAQLYAGLKKTEQELKESEQRYRELSIIDDLTQLYNSRHFYFQLKIELDRSNRYEQPLTLLLLDLDNFKHFNDAYGHVEGDQVLMRLGQVVKRCLRETDFAYRYGGEEFTILLPMTISTDGAVTAERIRTEFKKETFSPVPGQDVHVTVSIGLAQYKPQEEMKAFVHRVDQLMYQGKKNGKDKVCGGP